jgi:NAD(P)H dehydrogenase (quinone)
MHALIVFAHPDRASLTHALAARIAAGIVEADGTNTFEIADLSAEGFDPRFTAADISVHMEVAIPPADVAREQARIDRADALVLVYPVYWWSMPGVLKGWIDRVFANGWAYAETSDGKLIKRLGHLPVHLVALAGADARTYARHGYFGAMKTQIDHGIFNYCGAPVATSELLMPSGATWDAQLERVQAIGRSLFGAAKAADAA